MQPQEHLRERMHSARWLSREHRPPESSLIPHQMRDPARMLMNRRRPAGQSRPE